MRQRGAENLTRAIELYRQALDRDPDFARAYAGLAEAYALQPSYAGTSEKTAQPLVLAAVERAEALGERTSHVLGVRAFVHFRSREWQAAKNDFENAIAASPNDSDLLQWYSQYLAGVGWIEQSQRAAKAAVAVDPLSPVANQRAGVVSVWTNDPRAADSHFSTASAVGIQGAGLPEASIAFLLSERRIGEAHAMLIETQKARGQSTDWIDPVFAAMAKTGSTSAALDALHRDYTNGKLGVSMYVGALFFIGDVDGFYKGMNDVVASGEPFDVEVLFSRTGRPLREDPRFVGLASDLGLIDFWDKAGWPDMCARDRVASCVADRERSVGGDGRSAGSVRRTRSSHPWALDRRHPWRLTVRRTDPAPRPSTERIVSSRMRRTRCERCDATSGTHAG